MYIKKHFTSPQAFWVWVLATALYAALAITMATESRAQATIVNGACVAGCDVNQGVARSSSVAPMAMGGNLLR